MTGLRPRIDVPALLEDICRDGYAIRESVLSPAEVARLRVALDPIFEVTPLGRNVFEGFLTKRVYSPLAKTRALDDQRRISAIR